MDAPSLYKGISALGTSFISSTTYDGATKFAKGRTDGASKVMMLEFDPTTKTWVPINGKVGGPAVTRPLFADLCGASRAVLSDSPAPSRLR